MKEVDNVQKKLLAAAGQDVDAYMKEMEEVRGFFFCLTIFYRLDTISHDKVLCESRLNLL